MDELLARYSTLAVCGTAENHGRFRDRFEQVIYLQVSLDIPLTCVRIRTSNPYGQSAAEQLDLARHVDEVEPCILSTATLCLDGQRLLAELADCVEQCLRNG